MRDRIAAVLYQRDGFIVPWNEAAEFLARDYRATADAVIAELGLTRVTRSQNPPIHRYVTDWKADE